MRTELFDYELPEELVAQYPPEERDGGRLLCLEPGGVVHRRLTDLPGLVPEGALVVLNDTRVFRARLMAERPGGGRTELLLLKRLSAEVNRESWLALARPAKRLRDGMRLRSGELELTVESRAPGGEVRVSLVSKGSIDLAIEESGHVPLPPYMRRPDEPSDAERYQTVYARHTGSVAAPTAGLHLTPRLLQALEARRVERAFVTLHVGPGTFKPVSSDDLDQHDMHSEELEVGDATVAAVAAARARGAPVVAVGTTVVRALESARDPHAPGRVRATRGETRLLIQPGYELGVVDALLTNFHMPKSTLLALVAAFAGLDRVLAAYREAVRERYRFLSYGDAMWIPTRCVIPDGGSRSKTT